MRRRGFLLGGLALAGAAVAALVWWPGRWRYIVVHHSAGDFGDVELLRRVHRERFPNERLGMIPYHFLIGNGNGLDMGEIVETERWKNDLWGAHVRGAARNARGIGVCLIGNYDTGEVPGAQYAALVSLVRDLAEAHRIRRDNITLHGETPGEQTVCPGRNFPRARFFQDIAA